MEILWNIKVLSELHNDNYTVTSPRTMQFLEHTDLRKDCTI